MDTERFREQIKRNRHYHVWVKYLDTRFYMTNENHLRLKDALEETRAIMTISTAKYIAVVRNDGEIVREWVKR